jgi:hypothetical protein
MPGVPRTNTNIPAIMLAEKIFGGDDGVTKGELARPCVNADPNAGSVSCCICKVGPYQSTHLSRYDAAC